jgi:carbon monoxide dehydrogenase subunit G
MNFSGSKEIYADLNTVWESLLSAEVLKECVLGCKEMDGSPDEGFQATVVQKVGPVKATFKGEVTLSEIIVGESLTLSGSGKGGAAGFAKGSAQVQLKQENDFTVLSFEVEAKVGGKLAQLGSRLIDGFAKRMAEQFFEKFKATVEGPVQSISEETKEKEEIKEKKGRLSSMTNKTK